MRLARDVTAESYHGKAKAFILANDNEGFVIALPWASKAGHEPTPRQWGAWLAYFKILGKSTSLMERLGYFIVPAEWPHMFDADASVQADYAAADAYEAKERERVRSFNLSRAARTMAKGNSIWPQIRQEKFQATPEDHLRKREWWEDSPEREKLMAMGLENFPDRVPASRP